MKSSSLAACVLACGLAVFAISAEAKPTSFAISYTYAGLTELTVKDSKLHYVWHTARRLNENNPLALDSLEGYDRHQIDVWLTDKEAKTFQDWVARHKPFDFAKDYPSASDGTERGASYRAALSISQGDKKQDTVWVGDSKTPKELQTAVGELTALAQKIQKSRNQ
jgi:hypothetical protein